MRDLRNWHIVWKANDSAFQRHAAHDNAATEDIIGQALFYIIFFFTFFIFSLAPACKQVWIRAAFARVFMQDSLLCQQCSPPSRCLWVNQPRFYLFSPHSSALQRVQLFSTKAEYLIFLQKHAFGNPGGNAMQKRNKGTEVHPALLPVALRLFPFKAVGSI